VAPGYPVFLAAVARVTGFDMIALRLSSVVCMTAALLLFYAFLRRLGMRDDLAILALFFAGLNPVILEYGREVLSEALFCACVWAALYLFVRYEKQESAGFFLGGCFAAIMSFTVRKRVSLFWLPHWLRLYCAGTGHWLCSPPHAAAYWHGYGSAAILGFRQGTWRNSWAGGITYILLRARFPYSAG
jgi:predicted membrane-bound mannosyltransferase